MDYRVLNESVLCEVHPLPTVDETLAQMAGAAVFSKLDVNCGFWQIPQHENFQTLTTFITPFGHFYFKRLPFGISSAPEYFQWRMSAILAGHKGVPCHMDDIFIFRRDQGEHKARLAAALRSIQAAGVTLNADKCLFSQTSISFLVHIIDQNGVSADPGKTCGLADDHTLQHHRTSSVLRNGETTWEVFTQPCRDIQAPLRAAGQASLQDIGASGNLLLLPPGL